MTEPALLVSDLRKEFDGGGHTVVAVDNLSFSIEAGGALAVVGESGSGKTTVARMVSGLEQPTAGSIRIAGVERTAGERRRNWRSYSRQVQMVFQNPYASLDPRQDVHSCLDEVMRLHHRLGARDRASRITELLEQVGLDDRHARLRPSSLSGGQRQRVAIARALVVEPALLILDESVAALDVSIQAQILNLLNELRRKRGIAFLFITHDLAAARYVCETMIVMQRGKLIESGPSGQILSNPQSPYTQRLLAAVPRVGWIPMRAGLRSEEPEDPSSAGR